MRHSEVCLLVAGIALSFGTGFAQAGDSRAAALITDEQWVQSLDKAQNGTAWNLPHPCCKALPEADLAKATTAAFEILGKCEAWTPKQEDATNHFRAHSMPLLKFDTTRDLDRRSSANV